MAGADFLTEVPKYLFLRMRGENMPKTRLRCCQIATILVLTLFLRMRTKKIVKT